MYASVAKPFYAMNETLANVRRVSEGRERNAVAYNHVETTRGFQRGDGPRITEDTASKVY
jgi:hypothetical protein